MLASIHPLGERGRNARWATTVTAYLLGSSIGGAATGALLGRAGQAVESVVKWSGTTAAIAVVVLAICAAVLDLGLVGLRLPTPRRQVNEDWLHTYRGWVYGFGFGVQLGAGLVTTVATASVYLTMALAFLTRSWALGCAVGGAFGLVRGSTVLLVARVHRPTQLWAAHRRLQAWAAPVHRSCIALEVSVAAAAMVALVARG
jgi:MFS family permease